MPRLPGMRGRRELPPGDGWQYNPFHTLPFARVAKWQTHGT